LRRLACCSFSSAVLKREGRAADELVDRRLIRGGRLAWRAAVPQRKHGDRAHARLERNDLQEAHMVRQRAGGREPQIGLGPVVHGFSQRFGKIGEPRHHVEPRRLAVARHHQRVLIDVHRKQSVLREARDQHLQKPLHALVEVERGAQLPAGKGEELGAPRRLLGCRALGFQPGHGLGASLRPVQLDEHFDLAAQDLRDHRRQDVIDRAQRIPARGLHLVGVRGHEDDRRVLGLAVLADQLGGLDAVDVGHVDVEQDDREVALQELAQRVRAGVRHDQVLAKLLQYHLECQTLVRQVIDYKDVDPVVLHFFHASDAANP
jgi:hypothetical protein